MVSRLTAHRRQARPSVSPSHGVRLIFLVPTAAPTIWTWQTARSRTRPTPVIHAQVYHFGSETISKWHSGERCSGERCSGEQCSKFGAVSTVDGTQLSTDGWQPAGTRSQLAGNR